ncbi:unnamed protein product [Polarella glacialis]|nr:unnamed protein product [Polarella glacialis]
MGGFLSTGRLTSSMCQCLQDPNLVILKIDNTSETIISEVERETYLQATFLVASFLEQNAVHSTYVLPPRMLETIFEECPSYSLQDTRPIHFMFHTTYCGSTLMSRALAEMSFLPVREPAIYLYAVHQYLSIPESKAKLRQAVLDGMAWWLGRRYHDHEVPLVKAHDAWLMPEIIGHLSRRRESRMLFVYNDLMTHCLQLAIHQGDRYDVEDQWLSQARADDVNVRVELQKLELAKLSLMEMRAVQWTLRMVHYTEAVLQHPAEVLGIYAEEFLDEPSRVLMQVSRFLGRNVLQNEVDQVVKGGLFERYSKADPGVSHEFNEEQRAERFIDAMEKYDQEVKECRAFGRRFVESVASVSHQFRELLTLV